MVKIINSTIFFLFTLIIAKRWNYSILNILLLQQTVKFANIVLMIEQLFYFHARAKFKQSVVDSHLSVGSQG